MTKKEEFLVKVADESLKGRDMLLFVDAMGELGESNEDVLELLEDLKDEGQDISLNIEVPTINLEASLVIKDGILKTHHNKVPDADVNITIHSEETALDILLGKLPMLEAYRQNKLSADGQLTKVAALGLLMNITGDELGVL